MNNSDNVDNNSSELSLSCFNGKEGEDYGLWRMRLKAVCRFKRVWDVVEGKLSPSTTSSETTTTDQTGKRTTASSSESPIEKSEKASAIIISALGDALLRAVMEAEDDPTKMLKLLDARYASNRTVSRISVQTQLFRMTYNGQNMSSYIDQYNSLFTQLERMGKDAAIPESHKAPMLLASINPKCSLESSAAALRTKEVSELTWDYVATTLVDEFNAKDVSYFSFNDFEDNGKSKQKKINKQSQALTNLTEADDDVEHDSNLEKAVQGFSAALKSSLSNRSTTIKCEFCGKNGHKEEKCFLNLENPTNKLTPKMFAALTSNNSGEKKKSLKDKNKN